MKEQKFCATCGKVNFSQYFETCECKFPKFKFDTYDEYLAYQKEKENFEEEEEIVVCNHCGCEENAEEMRDGMCPDCYEDYLDDIRESEEDDNDG